MAPSHIPALQNLLQLFSLLAEIDISGNPLGAALPAVAEAINQECPLVTFKADSCDASADAVCQCVGLLCTFRKFEVFSVVRLGASLLFFL
jgi:hypothetical protein